MNTTDIQNDFKAAEQKTEAVNGSWGSAANLPLSVAIFQGLKLIALAIIYHANNN